MSIGVNGPGDVTLGAGDRAAAVAAVKQVLRVGLADEDALIGAFVESALGLAEGFLGRVTIARAMTETLPACAAWQSLTVAPVRAITMVAAIDASGAAAPLAIGDYAVDVDADGVGWVRTGRRGGRIAVTLEAGLATGWAALPAPIRQGAVLLAAHLFTARDASDPPPAAVTALWRPFRAIDLGRARAC